MTLLASVVIPTRNRKDLLKQAIQSSLSQSVPVEVIVVDDGSDDGTQEMMQTEFPQLRYERFQGPNGPSFLRSKGCELASCDIVFPIDDDACFVSSNTIEQTIKEFDDPRIGSVGIPFINVRKDQIILQQAPDDQQIYLTHAYVGASHALRRNVFLKAGAYHTEFFYMGEEGDACIRMLNLGYVMRLGRADPIHHFESPLRNSYRASLYGRQNDILFIWYNAPLRVLPIRLLRATIGGIYFAFFGDYQGKAWWHLLGLLRGYGMCIKYFKNRKPVLTITEKLYRNLKIRSCTPLAEVLTSLPPIQ